MGTQGRPTIGTQGRPTMGTQGRPTQSGRKHTGRHTQATLGGRQTIGSELRAEWELYGDYSLDEESPPPVITITIKDIS